MKSRSRISIWNLYIMWKYFCFRWKYDFSLRHAKGRNHLENMRRVRQLCKEYNILFKINTVVNQHNVNDDMSQEIKELSPIRWKVFQCLSIYAENEGPGALKYIWLGIFSYVFLRNVLLTILSTPIRLSPFLSKTSSFKNLYRGIRRLFKI